MCVARLTPVRRDQPSLEVTATSFRIDVNIRSTKKTQTVSYVQNEIERIASVVIAIDRIAIFFSQRPRRSIYCIRSGACRFDKKLSDRRGTARCQLPRNSTETTCTTKSFCRQSFTICAKTTVVERRSSEVLST